MRNDVARAEPYSGEALACSLDEILGATSLYSMASIVSTGESWINTAFFAYSDDLRLYFVSLPDAQHARNIAGNPSVAVSVCDTGQRGPKRGLQLFGTCVVARDGELDRGTEVGGRRFAWLAAMEPALTEPDAPAGPPQPRLFVVHPRTVKIFDELRFGQDVWITAAVAAGASPVSSKAEAIR